MMIFSLKIQSPDACPSQHLEEIRRAMKLRFFVLTIALWSSSATAQNWVLAHKEKNSDLFIDQQSIKRDASGIAEVWTLAIFEGPTAMSRKVLGQFDCKKRLARPLWTYHYEPGDKWGTKPPQSVEKNSKGWEEIPPDPPGTSQSKNVLKLVCGPS